MQMYFLASGLCDSCGGSRVVCALDGWCSAYAVAAASSASSAVKWQGC